MAGEATRAAEDLIQHVESLVVKEAPRLAGTVRSELDRVRAEVQSLRFAVEDERIHREHLRQLCQDLERLHEQDEGRITEAERLLADLRKRR